MQRRASFPEAHRVAVAEGRDPLADKRRAKMPTFAEAAVKVHEANLPRWRNGKHTQQWLATLELYAFPVIGAMRVDRIERRDVLSILTPIWAAKPETARRVRQRIRTVLKWAQAHDFVEHNSAGEGIDGALPPMGRSKEHFRALPHAEVPAALDTVEASPASMAAKACLRFLILTAARSGEARGATWAEIDMDAREWRIPGARMKGGQAHRVPLSDAAVAVLTEAARLRDASNLIFPSPRKAGRPLSDMSLTKLLRDTGLAGHATVHGFRSCFRDWAAECTNAPHSVMELSLAHAVGGAVEQAYARSTLIERRRALLAEWGGLPRPRRGRSRPTPAARWLSPAHGSKRAGRSGLPLSRTPAPMHSPTGSRNRPVRVILLTFDDLLRLIGGALDEQRDLPTALERWAFEVATGPARPPDQARPAVESLERRGGMGLRRAAERRGEQHVAG